ncbi:uncharacterized protein LOC143851443 [Tasmannia lanceolata]|uniref:uncharacterized protein LOC143851443 n=1 Tax=Tasmannia lanceolata TaxID=3420 RepID=UPI0040629FC7
MEGRRRERTWKNLKERLGLIGCCGSSWGFRGFSNNQMNVREEDEEEEEERMVEESTPPENPSGECVDQIPAVGMNLATALAAERHFRAATPPEEWEGTGLKVSLMRLLEEGDEFESEKEEEGNGVCCVCMGRRKDAAFIPCGHTFCRVCSKEVRVNRGFCPLCNRSILEILDIF